MNFFENLLTWALAAILVILAGVATVLAQSVATNPATLLPRQLNGYRQVRAPRPLQNGAMSLPTLNPSQGGISEMSPSGVQADYVSVAGNRFTVELVQRHKDSEAYSLFTFLLRKMREEQPEQQLSSADVGTVSAASTNRLILSKGQCLMRITRLASKSRGSDELLTLGRQLAETLNKGDDDIPVLVKHLPDWQARQRDALYVVHLKDLQNEFGAQRVFDGLSFEAGTEAVIAHYGNSQLVVVEFSTPQLAGDNDRRTIAKLKELWQAGLTAPTGYRRVGNYLAFVFDGQSEQAANQLIDQIKYEQVVQWLGENPYVLLEAQKQYAETTLGVFVAVVKASALALLLCFGIGGFFGGLLFSRRRAQQKAAEAYSDAGGMLRLNLDEMTTQTDPARLIGREN